MDRDDIDCRYTKDIVCPYCGYPNTADDYADGMDTNNQLAWDCHKCEREFKVTVDFDVTFISEKKPTP